MKKFFTFVLMAAASITASAQLSDGFYRIQNDYSERYLLMNDRYGARNGESVDVSAMITIKPFNTINNHPGTIFWVENKGGTSYDFAAQGASLGSISGGLYPQLFANGSCYQFYAEKDGYSIYLLDPESPDVNQGELMTKGSQNSVNWRFLPIGGDNYIGIDYECQTGDGRYWATFYFGFNYKLGSGMEAYYVKSVDETTYTLEKVAGSGDIVPSATPLLIKLNSKWADDNIITPTTSGASFSRPTDNKLTGVYFSSTNSGHHKDYNITYNSTRMRILGTENGELVFRKAEASNLVGSSYIPHNHCYIDDLNSSYADELWNVTSGISTIKAEEAKAKKGIFTLTGQQLPEGATPRSGIYVKDGKKVVIK